MSSSGDDDADAFVNPAQPPMEATTPEGRRAAPLARCLICREPWANKGPHRIVATPCGHLFGLRCITQWLSRDKSCPVCKAKVTTRKNQLRPLYVSNISVIDATELLSVREQLAEERSRRLKVEAELATLRHNYEVLQRSWQEQLRLGPGAPVPVPAPLPMASPESRSPDAELSRPKPASAGGDPKQFARILRVGELSDARVLDLAPEAGLLFVSGSDRGRHGLYKLSLVDPSRRVFIDLKHDKPIRDLSYHPETRAVITASLDGRLKLCDADSGNLCLSIAAPTKLWSCAWLPADPNMIYAGANDGSIVTFDIRKTDHPVATTVQEHRNPVLSLCTADGQPSLLAGSSAGVSEFRIDTAAASLRYRGPVRIGRGGSCTSLCVDPLSRQCLASFRPQSSGTSPWHEVFSLQSALDGEAGAIPMSRIGHPCTATRLARACIFCSPFELDRTLVAIPTETTHNVALYEPGVGAIQSTEAHPSAVLAVRYFDAHDGPLLVTLSAGELHGYAPGVVEGPSALL